MKRVFNYILNGVLIFLPLFVTFFLLYKIFDWFNENVFVWLDQHMPGERRFPGMGILMMLLLLGLLGWLGTKFINQPIRRWFQKILGRIPLIKTIYQSIRDLLGAFVGGKKRFNQPVLVKLSRDMDLEVIGFVTDEDLAELGDFPGKVAVYFPMSYSFSGHLVLVPKSNVTRVDRNAVDVFKYIVSGGVVEIDADEKP